MINQPPAGVHIAATTEVMALGPCAWVDSHTLYEAISSSAGDFTPLSAGDIFVKDPSSVLDDAT